MAHTVTITHGTTTITLTLVDHTPASAPAGQPTVTERWEVRVSGATKAALQTTIHGITRAFELARQRQRDAFLDRVYLNFQPDGFASSYRSEILDGSLVYYDETLKWAWADTAFDVKLVITRRNFWEGAEATIPMSNSNGTDANTLNVYNAYDLSGSSPNKRDNTITIDADDLEGDLPAPIKLTLTEGSTLKDVILTADMSPDSHVHKAECEDAWSTDDTVDATCSDGNAGSKDFTAVDTAANVFTWSIPSAWDIEPGRWYLPFLRLRTVPEYTGLWTRILIETGTDKGTPWIKYPATSGPQVIQYPPIRAGLPNISGNNWMRLRVQFKASESGTKTIDGDYLYMLPVDGARFYTIEDWETLTDDPYEDLVYYTDGGFTGSKLVQYTGQPLMIDPRAGAVLYMISTGSTAPITGYVTAALKYRPRRLAL